LQAIEIVEIRQENPWKRSQEKGSDLEALGGKFGKVCRPAAPEAASHSPV